MVKKAVPISYFLGISLVLTGIIYFFAANWQGLDRFDKIALCLALLCSFYVLHFLLRYVHRHPFLSDWTLVAASIVFGIAIALVGQIYNAHADSYILFFIWMIAALLLALITTYAPFYVLSFLLAQLTMFTFISPSSYLPDWAGIELLVMYVVIMALNATLFFVCRQKWIHSKTLYYLAYVMALGTGFTITVDPNLPFHELSNTLYVLLLVGIIIYWYRIAEQRAMLIISSIIAEIYFLVKVINWVFAQEGTWVLVVLLCIAILLVTCSVILATWLLRQKNHPVVLQLLTVITTIIASLFATLAISGLFFILFPGATNDALFFFSLLALILPGLLIRLNAQVRYPLLGSGLLINFGAGLTTSVTFYTCILLAVLLIALFIVEVKGLRVFLYLFANLTAAILLADWIMSMHLLFLTLLLINFACYLLEKKPELKKTALIVGMFYFLFLTVFQLETSLQLIYSMAFFLLITGVLLFARGKKGQFEWNVCLVFWFLFLGYQYYEYLWTLVHKSILSLILGLLFIAAAVYMERRQKPAKATGAIQRRTKTSLLILVILLQFAIIGYQAFSSEHLLQEGQDIKLELEPVDPRSILQGDYLVLRYEITELPETLPASRWNKKIQIVLREKDGVYEYSGHYKTSGKWNKAYEEKPGDILLNGKAYSSNEVSYGIESYFIEEGTGRKMEQNLHYANVRVSASGDAMIESVE